MTHLDANPPQYRLYSDLTMNVSTMLVPQQNVNCNTCTSHALKSRNNDAWRHFGLSLTFHIEFAGFSPHYLYALLWHAQMNTKFNNNPSSWSTYHQQCNHQVTVSGAGFNPPPSQFLPPLDMLISFCPHISPTPHSL